MPTVKAGLSPQRFEAFRRLKADTDEVVAKNYLRNVALCEALYPSMHFLEIALRNGIHTAATNEFATNTWFDLRQFTGDARTRKIIAEVKTNLQRSGKPVTADGVVAGLHFGYWFHLFESRYESVLWRRIVKQVFPHAPKKERQRASIAPRIHQAKELRNRISHHEPVWHWQDLEDQHIQFTETIGWINPSLASLLALTDRFPFVYNKYSADFDHQLSHLDLS